MFITKLVATVLTLLPCNYDTGCSSYQLYSDEAKDPIADCLTALGWQGVGGDGQAKIYAPANVIEWCIDNAVLREV